MKKAAKTEEVEKEILTYSRIASALGCPMREYYQYGVEGVGIETVAPIIPFIEGDLLHYALKFFYRSGRMLRVNLMKRVEKSINELKEQEGGITPELDDKLQVGLCAMTAAALSYKLHYKSDLDRYEMVLVEEPFEFEFEDVIFKGKLDLLTRDKEDGSVMLWEHKSAAQVSKDAFSILPLNLQDFIYALGTHSLLGELPTFKVRNWVLKTGLRRKKDKAGGMESMAQYEARVGAQYIEDPEKKFFRTPPMKVQKTTLDSVKKQLSLILAYCRNAQENPFMRFTECEGKYGLACRYGMACIAKLQGHANGWDAAECQGLYRLKEELHPELKKEEDDVEEKEKE